LELEKIYCLLSLKIDVTSYSGPLAEDRWAELPGKQVIYFERKFYTWRESQENGQLCNIFIT
jgi:hypothetical protein